MTTTLTPPATSGTDAPMIREMRPDDAGEAARILFEAFAGIHDRHAFPRDFPTPAAAEGLVTAFAAHPEIWGVVAERDGRIVGSNFLDERSEVRGVGPITVDPAEQATGIGRRLMAAVLDRAGEGARVRLQQDAFNTGTLALYQRLGFAVREPMALLAGTPAPQTTRDVRVRPMEQADLAGARDLALRVLGYERTRELADALAAGLGPVVAVRDRRVVAAASSLTVWPAAFGVAERDEDMRALIAGGTPAGTPVALLLPTRQEGLFRWCLEAGLRVVKPMTYMSVGEYRAPRGAWFPSVLA